MRKNYYARIIPTIDDIDALRAIKEQEPVGNLLKRIDELSNPIHIGKSSVGWHFLFNYNNKRFYSSVEELKAWLKTVEIRDEYGGLYSFDEFWEMVLEKKANTNNKYHGYNAYKPKEYRTIEDGFCFSTSSDFS